MAKVGRKSKWNTPDHHEKMKELVYLYRNNKEKFKIISIADMVRFSAEMNQKFPSDFPDIYKKDVWIDWGREYINSANKPLVIKIDIIEGEESIEIPNVSDIIEKDYNNKDRLLSSLLAYENLMHKKLKEIKELSSMVNLLQEKNKELIIKNQKLETEIENFESDILQMAHHSRIKSYREKYGLINQISVNANARNRKLMNNLDKLEEIFDSKDLDNNMAVKNNDMREEAPNTVLVNRWKNKRKK
ncbi:hypothetical protein COD70_26270 [Bacillus cereus]|nr:hypothetical protein COD70_26270 [Bacillus cereus]